MLSCDLCGKEIDRNKGVKFNNSHTVSIYYEYACSAHQSKDIDICDDCYKELRHARYEADITFYKKKMEKRSNGRR